MKALPDKVDPLIRRLATDNDGEALACVRALARVLKSAGMSFHDLADAITKPAATAYYEQPGRKYHYEPPPTPDPPPFEDAPFRTWAEVMEFLVKKADEPFSPLREKEKEFVRSARDGVRSYGKPTERQEKWIRDILKRCGAI